MTHRQPSLQDLRERRDLSRKEVASQLGMTERHLVRIEREGVPVRGAYLLGLAAIYGVPVEEIKRAADRSKAAA